MPSGEISVTTSPTPTPSSRATPEPMAMPEPNRPRSPAAVSGCATSGTAARSSSRIPSTSTPAFRPFAEAITWPRISGAARVTPGTSASRPARASKSSISRLAASPPASGA